jgi:SAM-dependent methyltransferase
VSVAPRRYVGIRAKKGLGGGASAERTPFEPMIDSSKFLVANGYDLIAEVYLERYARSAVRDHWLRKLIALLPQRARILDLGCGAGIPVARELAALGFQVLGVDGSARQIELARANAPTAEFLQADMNSLQFSADSFDAVAAFYSVTHVPRTEHAALFREIAKWLRPGGVFVASLRYCRRVGRVGRVQ